MSRFKRLTDEEARTLTRHELLDRVEAEEAYWTRKYHGRLTDADRAAAREFSRIMHTYLSIGAALQAATDTANGTRSNYWDTRPCDDPGRTPAPEAAAGTEHEIEAGA